MVAVELDAEHRARERLGDLTFDLDLLFPALANPSLFWKICCFEGLCQT